MDSGYSPQDRRKIEQEAFSGHLLGIVATNALELGVDIGVLDAVIMLGFPIGGMASYVSVASQTPSLLLTRTAEATSRASWPKGTRCSGCICC